jgi:hypothetical protein
MGGMGPEDTNSNVDHSVQYFDQNFNESGIDDDS